MNIYCDKCGSDIKDKITHQCSRKIDTLLDDSYIKKVIYDAIYKHNIKINVLDGDIHDLVRYCLHIGYSHGYNQYKIDNN